MKVNVWMLRCLDVCEVFMHNYTKTAGQIWIEFGTEVANALQKHIGYFFFGFFMIVGETAERC